jgi:hypothetical protein
VNNRNPETVYKERIEAFERQSKELNKIHFTLGMVKLVLAITGLLGLLDVFPGGTIISMSLFGICLVLFVVTAFIHETVIRKIKYCKTLKTINDNELLFLIHQFPANLDNGEEFRDPEHNYSSDLDIFGSKGIFHYINRAVTAMGKRCLADRLKRQTDAEEIKKSQGAVNELARKVYLRQTTAAHGLHIDDSSKKLDGLYLFLEEPFTLLGRKRMMIIMIVWPLLTLAAAVLIAFNVPFIVFLLFVLSQMMINKRFDKRVSHLYDLTSQSHKILKAYSSIIHEIETEEADSPKLKELKERLSADPGHEGKEKASLCIRRLSTLLEWFDTRNGMLHFLVNNTLLWDLHCMYKIEKWRKETAHKVDDWFDVIAQFEMLCSLAALYFNNPDWVLPEICPTPFRLEAVAAGHPLIPEKERVCNDVSMNSIGNSAMMIVTGPNMAGKSTFLRTVGVNLVLAFAGGPVCAEQFRVSPVNLFTSMQTSDSLDKHLSLFYAELQRLKMILDGISLGEPVFFLIDEMLKGTNALDRQKGAIALLKQLLENHANGIVATHDLELTKVASANFHFDGYIEGDKLLFDYKLKEGTCKSFNALVLMKKMGIRV